VGGGGERNALSSVARDDAALAEINNPQRWEREEEEEGVRVGVAASDGPRSSRDNNAESRIVNRD